VFTRLGQALLIVAVLAATGTDWFILQSVAWTTMLADNLRTTTFSHALERTFDGKHPCCLCKQIAQGRRSEKRSQFSSPWKKLEFVRNEVGFAILAPTSFRRLRAGDTFAYSLTHAPPLPPPRAALA
jgi:hypothetical protein